MNNRNLLAALTVGALLIVAAITAGCTTQTSPSLTPTPIVVSQTTVGNNTTFSSSAGFNITFPKTLKINSTTDVSVPQKVYIYLNSSNVIDGVVVATQDWKGSLQDFTAAQKSNITSQFKNVTFISNRTNFTFSGEPAYQVVWQGTVPVNVNETTTQNMSLKAMQTFVVHNNTGYVVTYKTVTSDYDTYLALAEQILNTFKLT
jgi:hypothetical protein